MEVTGFDLSRLPDLLARLDETLPSSGLPFTESWQQDRREAASAIRVLLERRDNAERAAPHVEAKIKLAGATEREQRQCERCLYDAELRKIEESER